MLRRPRRLALGAAGAGSLVVLGMAAAGWLPVDLSLLEVLAVLTGGWSVGTLARNLAVGWWLGLVSVAAFAVVFLEVRLFAEVGIQVFYFVTSLQAIYIWLRGGRNRTGRTVSHAPRAVVLLTAPLFIGAVLGLQRLLIAMNGAAPFWDALTAVMSITAHLYLICRFVESWWLWIAVDVVYVPLYVSRGLALTAVLYVVFLFMSVGGLRRFHGLALEGSPG